MGITGLLPFLKAIQRDVHLSSFRGKKAAVDSYCWLHKGAYSCAMQLVMGTANLETLPFIRYCMKRVHLMKQYDITPIMVFDGGYLPTKAHTEQERRERRRGYLDKGKQLLKDGKKSDANDCFQKCVDVSPEMALALIKECRKIGVECVVAPYEADAQLTYLQKEGIVDFVITEDSDLLVFGCGKVLFKMDDSGNGKLIELYELGKANKGLVGFTQDSFRQMCIFSGCDYLPSVPGIGLGKSLKLMRRCNQNPNQVIKTMQCETGKVPKNYEEEFRRAEYTFLYQLVFDPRSQKQVRLNTLPDNIDPSEFEFAGVELSPKKAVHMARGNIDPITLRVLDSYSPSKAPPPKSTTWEASAMSGSSRGYPLAIQAKLPLIATDKSRQPFRAPKRKLVEEEEESLREEELCTMYGTSTQSESQASSGSMDRSLSASLQESTIESEPIITSRFFPTSTSPQLLQSSTFNEETPSDTGLHSMTNKSSRRVLHTNQQSSTCLNESLDSSKSENVMKCNKTSEDGQLSVKKQLFSLAPKENIQVIPSKYEYSSAKRMRRTSEAMAADNSKHPFELLEQSSQSSSKQVSNTTDLTVRHNPFSLSRLSPKHSQSFKILSTEVSSSPTNLASPDYSEQSNTSIKQASPSKPQFLTSRSFINPHPSLKLDSQGPSNGLPDEGTKPKDNGEDCACSDDQGHGSLPLASGWLGKRRTSLSQATKKRVRNVGLSKSSSSSKFRAPRSADSDSNQTTLGSFGYTRKPQLKH